MTDQPPEFEDVPVVRLTRPGDAQRAQVSVLVVLAVFVILIVKPWGEGRRTTAATPSASPTPGYIAPSRGPAATPRADGAHVYDPALFGRFAVTPRWELWPTVYVYKFGLSGPLDLGGSGQPGASGQPVTPPASPPPDAGQLVDIGASDLLVVLGLNTPNDTRIVDARLWRFPADGSPLRMALRELPPPWPVQTFHVYGLAFPGDADPSVVAPWPPGIYRLDLLVDPDAQIRRIGLAVRPAAESGGPGSEGPGSSQPPSAAPGASFPAQPGETFLAPVVGSLAFRGPDVSWSVEATPDPTACGLAELWLAELDRPGGPCSAILASDVIGLAADLGPDRPIRRLTLRRLDPVVATIPVVDRTGDQPTGRVITTADGRPLAEGTYRLVASLADGSAVGWSIRIGSADGSGVP
jgi:hypothetical protein